MSAVPMENGRADGIGAPVQSMDKSVEFDIDRIEDAALSSSETPSKHDPNALDAYAAAGHELIPIKGKRPILDGWPDMPAMSLSHAKERFAAGSNIGVRLRATDLVIDVDPRHFAKGDNPLKRLKTAYNLPFAPVVNTGGGGQHLYLRKPADAEVVNSLPDYKGIEFKSLGRQVVAAGSIHPDTGKPYLLDDDPLGEELCNAPEATTALLDAIAKRLPPTWTSKFGEITSEQLEKLLSKLDVTRYNHLHDDWLAIMMACHHATAGEGVDEFVAWSTSDPEYADQEQSIRNRWRSLKVKPDGVKLGTLIKALSDAGHRAWVDEVLSTPAEEDFAEPVEVPQTMSDIALTRMNQDHFTVLHGGKYLVGRERTHPTLGHVEVEWFSAGAVRAHLDSRIVEVEDSKQKPLGSWWVKHPRRRQYDGVVFDPAPDRAHERLYNLWRGWAVEPEPGDWSLMRRLLRDVLCRGHEDSFDYVLRWAAFMVQKPHVPAEVALVFKGTKGVGKGTFGRALKLLAGMHGKQVAQAEHFVGRFNEHLMDCILLFVDEGYWAGDPKAAGALKNLITEPVLSFEPKGRPIVSGPNMLHVVIASNEEWIVPASVDERRFAAFEADTEARRRLPSDFFDTLNAQMSAGGLSAMLHDLLTLDLGDWHPRRSIPNTQALVEQKVQAFRRDPLSFWWFRMLEVGAWDPSIRENDWIADFVEIDSIGKEQMLIDIGAIARGMNRPGQFSKKAVAQFLKTVGVEVDAKNKKGARVWRIPRLASARAAFETYVGGSIAWDCD